MFTKILRNYRLNNNISQQEMAKKLNISQNSVSNYEKGTSVPQLDVAARLADLLNMSLDELAGRDFKGADTNTLGSKEKSLIEIFRLIKEDDKDRVIIILQSMIDLNANKEKDITA